MGQFFGNVVRAMGWANRGRREKSSDRYAPRGLAELRARVEMESRPEVKLDRLIAKTIMTVSCATLPIYLLVRWGLQEGWMEAVVGLFAFSLIFAPVCVPGLIVLWGPIRSARPGERWIASIIPALIVQGLSWLFVAIKIW